MTQLTLRGFDPDLERALRRVAKEEGVSLNQAALRLLRKGAGLSGAVPHPIGSGLDAFLGTLTAEDALQVDAAVREADRADLAFQKRARSRAR
jgi:hypothetical protein